ncbi:MAG: hypothetical protein H7281_05075 [Bacteriovorax sp.]|nr:hypothetical protein [Bacteriovorax sp.]
MRKLNYLSHFTHISLIAFIAVLAAVSPLRLVAQDDMPNDEETIMPASNNSGTPPVIIDESDSGAVNDVEEYDG